MSKKINSDDSAMTTLAINSISIVEREQDIDDETQLLIETFFNLLHHPGSNLFTSQSSPQYILSFLETLDSQAKSAAIMPFLISYKHKEEDMICVKSAPIYEQDMYQFCNILEELDLYLNPASLMPTFFWVCSPVLPDTTLVFENQIYDNL